MSASLELKQGRVKIPSHIFTDRTLSVLEAISEYLKDELHFTYHEIAAMMNRDDRTIWTCYYRAKRKRAAAELRGT
ncbi:MAG TPA: hypothetical protein VJC16_01840 [Candidatus Nanoarchaeia archaeon]|nr:hypothetical protein [Candidatus Nanoarchaeia archaeon]